jgi:hypothetical protein
MYKPGQDLGVVGTIIWECLIVFRHNQRSFIVTMLAGAERSASVPAAVTRGQ